MPEYPLDPCKEMSEGEYMGSLEDPEWDPADHQGPIPDAVAELLCGLIDDASLERSLRARGYRSIRSWAGTIGEPIKVQSDPYIEMYRKTYGDEVLAAGLSLLELLGGDIWVTKDGEKLTAAQMTPSHASNLKAWLERRAIVVLIAAQMRAGCAEIDHDGGMHAHDAIEAEANELHEIDPLGFLRRLKLYQAIVNRSTETESLPVMRRRSAFACPPSS